MRYGKFVFSAPLISKRGNPTWIPAFRRPGSVILGYLEYLLHSRPALQFFQGQARCITDDANDDAIGAGRLMKIEIAIDEIFFDLLQDRITSYNVCYTKLLRIRRY